MEFYYTFRINTLTCYPFVSLQLKPLHLNIEEIDRKQLAEVRRRFMAINKHRISRIREDAGRYLRGMLDSLPLLLHVNHPALPGYLSKKTPCSISDYTPSKIQITATKKISRSFSYEKKARLRRDIYSIFLMGSMGTLGQSYESDLDIWVVHRANIDSEVLSLLQKKLRLIEQWAAQNQVKLHFFLMPPDYFKRQQCNVLDQENCGSSQHLLLLEEFYRTALLLAGRYPLWWLVPPHEEKNYDNFANNLIRKRFLRSGDWIDFGGVPSVPVEEYFGAVLWHLHKAIDSPYKSSLKMLLMEAYAAEYPNLKPVCLQLKKNIYEGKVGALNIDPYVLIYNKIENYLVQNGEKERVNWIRRCLYLKTHERLSIKPRNVVNSAVSSTVKQWRREMMTNLVKNWGWQVEHLKYLDSRKNWKIEHALEERKSIVHELSQSYKFMNQFAKDQGAMRLISSEDMSVLGRKLHANFERRADKVERVNPRVSPDLLERELTVNYVSDNLKSSSWALHKNSVDEDKSSYLQPVFRHKELMGLITWAYINGLATVLTQVKVSGKEAPVDSTKLREMIRILRDDFPVPENSADINAYKIAAKPKKSLYIINLCAAPIQSELQRSNKGLSLVSERSDPLGFGSQRENLILSVDIILCNSWNEVVYKRLAGENAVLRLLQDVYQNKLSNPEWNYQLRSAPSNNANTIEKRMKMLVNSILAIDVKELPARFVWNQGKYYQFLGLSHDVIEPILFNSMKELQYVLAYTENNNDFVSTRFDENCCSDLPLQLISKNAEKSKLKIYFFTKKETMQIWVSDETGAIAEGQQPFDDKSALLRTYQLFLSSVAHRQNFEKSLTPMMEVEYFDLKKTAGIWKKTKFVMDEQPAPLNFYPIQALIESNAQNETKGVYSHQQITIYCGDVLFSGLAEGEQLFNKIALHMKSLRKKDSHYPLYITDLDLSALEMDGPRSSLRYLEHKWWLEQRLNEVL